VVTPVDPGTEVRMCWTVDAADFVSGEGSP
jgi:hypothetical protein